MHPVSDIRHGGHSKQRWLMRGCVAMLDLFGLDPRSLETKLLLVNLGFFHVSYLLVADKATVSFIHEALGVLLLFSSLKNKYLKSLLSQ